MIIIGAGGFAKEILDILFCEVPCNKIVFYDDVSKRDSDLLFGKFRIITDLEVARNYILSEDRRFTLGIGKPLLRAKFYEKFNELGGVFSSTISRNADIGSFDIQIGSGCNILSGVKVSSGVSIGIGCLVYYNTIITHDTTIGDFVELSPGVTLLGRSVIGDFTQVGAGAIILPDIKVGKNVVIGAGSVVTKNIADDQLVMGVPARSVKEI